LAALKTAIFDLASPVVPRDEEDEFPERDWTKRPEPLDQGSDSGDY
jgi:hypothetical protein